MELIHTIEKAARHSREVGKFIVICRNDVKVFNHLLAAFLYYYKLKKEATLWDVTGDEAELLEKKCFSMQSGIG